MGKTFQFRKIARELANRKSRQIYKDVVVQTRDGHGLSIPGSPPAMRHNQRKIRKVHGHIIHKNWIAVFEARIAEHRRSRMNQHGHTQFRAAAYMGYSFASLT